MLNTDNTIYMNTIILSSVLLEIFCCIQKWTAKNIVLNPKLINYHVID